MQGDSGRDDGATYASGQPAPVAASAARDGRRRGCMGELEWPDDDAIAHVINGGE